MCELRRQCRHVYSWKTGHPDDRCPRLTFLGTCVEHRLERWRWEWAKGPIAVGVDLSSLNRPQLMIDDDCPPGRWSWISWSFGNGGVDPAFEILWKRPAKELSDA